MSENSTTRIHTSNANAITRFLNGEAGVICNYGRLSTYQADEDRVLLLSYTNEIIGEVTDGGSSVTIHTGHYGQVSKTTTEHLKALGSVLANTSGKEVTSTDRAPTMGVGSRASDAAQYINNYVGSFRNSDWSPVELAARETVEAALQDRVSQLFG
jgi:hypothetical protein